MISMCKLQTATSLIFLGLTKLAISQEEGLVVDLSESSPALHFPIGKNGEQVPVVPASEDYAYMLEVACEAMGLGIDECLIYTMNAEIGGNAIATILDGNQVIVYGRTLSPIVGYGGAVIPPSADPSLMSVHTRPCRHCWS